MIITTITLNKSHLALKQPFTTALRSVSSIDEVIITLHTQSFLAYGSAPAALAVTGESLERIYDDLQKIAIPAFTGYELVDLDNALKKLHTLGLCKSAQAAMDIALHDLFAKIDHQPLYRYLGGTPRALQTLYTISINTPLKMLLQAKKAYALGFKKLKIKLDKDVKKNSERVRLIYESLPDAELFLDLNQALDLKQSKALISSLQNIPVTLLEQPVQAKELEAMQALTALKTIPILADESVFSFEDAQKAIKMKACDFINIKLMKCGGIYEAKKILELCQKEGIKCMMGSMLEGGISVTAALHLAYAYDNVIFADLDGPTLASETNVAGGISYDTMELSLKNSNGLGTKPRPRPESV